MTSLEGPVETVDGQLMLRIPLDAGGSAFVDCTRGIGQVVHDELRITIPGWLAEKLGIAEGSVVIVDDDGGKFNITTPPST